MKRIVHQLFSVFMVFCITAVSVLAFAPEPAAAAEKPFKQRASEEIYAELADYGEMLVSWKKVKDADGYQVYRAASKNGTYKKIATVKSFACYDRDLTFGKLYYYKVRAYKKSGGKTIYSQFCEPKSRRATTVSNGFESVKIDKNGNVTVKINKSTGAAGYYVYTATGEFSTYKQVKKTTKRTATFKVNAGKPIHYFKVVPYIKVNDKIYKGRNHSIAAYAFPPLDDLNVLTMKQFRKYLSAGLPVEKPNKLKDSLLEIYLEEHLGDITTEADTITVECGSTHQIAYTVEPTAVKKSRIPVDWRSENDDVAAVSVKGVITAKTEGETWITGTLDNRKYVEIKVNVISAESEEEI